MECSVLPVIALSHGRATCENLTKIKAADAAADTRKIKHNVALPLVTGETKKKKNTFVNFFFF